MTLADLIEEALATDAPDPHDLARDLVSKLDDADRDLLVYDGLLYRLRHRIQHARAIAAPRPGPSRWKIAARVFVGGAWKMLDDCDFGDLVALAQDYRERAAQMLTMAEECERLAAALRASGAATVGELREREEVAA